jgi:2-dehydropantoate 2-reductase
VVGLLGGSLREVGHEVTLLDVLQEAVNTINRKGLTIEQKLGEAGTITMRASSDPGSVGEVDYVINFVKCYPTESAVKSAKLMSETTVLTLQNGWGNLPRMASIVGELSGQRTERLKKISDALASSDRVKALEETFSS